MNTTIETIPTVWDDERDGQFFRITASLFEPAFCSGAGAMLASYDPEDTFGVSAPAVESYDRPLIPGTVAEASTNPASRAA